MDRAADAGAPSSTIGNVPADYHMELSNLKAFDHSQVHVINSVDVHNTYHGVHPSPKASASTKDVTRDDVLAWLLKSSINFDIIQRDNFERHTPETGQWLLNSTDFQKWMDSGPNIVWCHGIPGAGKTIVASIVIDYVRNSTNTKRDIFFSLLGLLRGAPTTIGLAFIYCRHNDPQQTALAFGASILLQLLEQSKSVSENLKSLYAQHNRGSAQTQPSFLECLAVLEAEVAHFHKVYLVIDALDEYNDEVKQAIIPALEKLRCLLNVFVTSQHIPGMEERLSPTMTWNMDEANAQDIDVYIEARMNSDGHLRRRFADDPNLQDAIRRKVIENASGMFLLAQLHMNLVAKAAAERTMQAVWDALENLKDSYDETYKKILAQIKKQKSSDVFYAGLALRWITMAHEPLTMHMLIEAIALRIERHQSGNVDYIPEKDILDICLGLVIVEHESKVVRFAHNTTKEYLQREHVKAEFFPNAEQEIVTDCLKCLLQADAGVINTNAQNRSVDTSEANELRLHVNDDSFFAYASRYWGSHIKTQTENQFQDDLLFFLKDERRVQRSAKFFVPSIPGREDISPTAFLHKYPEPATVHGIHIVAFLGLESTIHTLIQSLNVEVQDSNGWTALWWAALGGQDKIVDLLLGALANPDVKDRNGHHILIWALGIKSWTLKSLQIGPDQILSEYTRNWNDRVSFETVSTADTVRGRTSQAVIAKLIDASSTLNVRDESGWTPLALAAQNKQWNLVRRMIGKGADINMTAADGLTCLVHALHCPLLTQTYEVFHFQNDADVSFEVSSTMNGNWTFDITDYDYSRRDIEPIIARLIGDDLEVPDPDGRTALSLAVELRYSSIVSKLLAAGANVHSRDSQGRTPLIWSAIPVACAQRLRMRDVHVSGNLTLSNKSTLRADTRPRFRNIRDLPRQRYEKIAQLLLKYGAGVEAKDDNERTPLSYAVQYDLRSIIRTLIQHKARIHPSLLVRIPSPDFRLRLCAKWFDRTIDFDEQSRDYALLLLGKLSGSTTLTLSDFHNLGNASFDLTDSVTTIMDTHITGNAYLQSANSSTTILDTDFHGNVEFDFTNSSSSIVKAYVSGNAHFHAANSQSSITKGHFLRNVEFDFTNSSSSIVEAYVSHNAHFRAANSQSSITDGHFLNDVEFGLNDSALNMTSIHVLHNAHFRAVDSRFSFEESDFHGDMDFDLSDSLSNIAGTDILGEANFKVAKSELYGTSIHSSRKLNFDIADLQTTVAVDYNVDGRFEQHGGAIRDCEDDVPNIDDPTNITLLILRRGLLDQKRRDNLKRFFWRHGQAFCEAHAQIPIVLQDVSSEELVDDWLSGGSDSSGGDAPAVTPIHLGLGLAYRNPAMLFSYERR